VAPNAKSDREAPLMQGVSIPEVAIPICLGKMPWIDRA
jgi:hypothetical protein